MSSSKKIGFLLKTALIPLVLPIAISGCSKDQSCGYNQPAAIISASAPATGHINQDIAVSLYFAGANSCLQYGTISQYKDGFNRYIQLAGNYEGCDCPNQRVVKPATYTFTTATAGTYYLNFLDSGDHYLVDTIVVSR